VNPKLVWAVVGVLFGTWLIGVVLKLADGLFHLLFVFAGILGTFNLVRMVSKRGPATE
jgi:hypothetical protein